MPRYLQLPDSVIDNIAEQIAESLTPSLEDVAGQLEIAESFEVWSLISISATTIRQAFENTGEFHHQLFAGTLPIGYARSSQETPSSPRQVNAVVKAPLAAKIEAAIEIVETLVPEDVEAKLLFADQFHTCLMWFDATPAGPTTPGTPATPDRCFIVSAPAKFMDPLQINSLIPAVPLIIGAQFLTSLRTLKPIRGLKLDPNISR